MNIWKEFHGPNAGYIVELYDKYREDPDSVDPATRDIFEKWKPEADGMPSTLAADVNKIVGAVNYSYAIREYGHLSAKLDPLGINPPAGDPALNPGTHGLTEEDLRKLPARLIGGPVAEVSANALEATKKLKKIYSSKSGYNCEYLYVREQREWLRQSIESESFRPPLDPINSVALLDRLTQVEVFELFIHRMFPGKFRFSIEGLDMMVPMMNELIAEAAEDGILNILLGMAHRGRLNILAHVLNKPYSHILSVFKDPVRSDADFREDIGWTGDVKYHEGARRSVQDGKGGKQIDQVVTLAPNPSHLEAVNPVVEGMARAAGTRVDEPGPPNFDSTFTLPILIHGDAGFCGQGVVAETLNFSRIPGYTTGGTIHIIANNRLGYTTSPEEGRSTYYASDLAKGFEIPVVHVNADDPEACIEAARIAFAYRAEFHKDFLINLVGYRRYGHNEADEPRFTQPLMYEKIETHPTVREIWAKELQERGEIDDDLPEELVSKYMGELHSVLESLDPEEDVIQDRPDLPSPGAAQNVVTAVSAEKLRELNQDLLKVPGDFNLHSKIKRGMEKRREILENLDEPTIDWATAEDLALATILSDGISIRLSGQDSERGTFSQRHAVFHDIETGDTFTPLQSIPQAKAAFEILNSPLTENAVLGFEYGYNIQEPGRLVIWEAQYGDFINGAQVVVDEFITSARAKWGQTPSLVLLLPHGYEGQGPDHCSARLERFLQLAAEANIRIANCTTSAQYFHLLRLQAALLRIDPLPLVVMTPKSLLRHPNVASSLRELSEGKWQPVIDDCDARERADRINRLILCSGKIYVDLTTSEHREKRNDIAIVRVEQLYPLPKKELKQIINSYQNIKELVWVQEEPENMGAWTYMWPKLNEFTNGEVPVQYIGRRPNSSPAEGFSSRHKINQEAIVEQAFDRKSFVDEKGVIWSKNN